MAVSFTIIVPTLNRAETLYYTLQTVVKQNYAALSIIVSDNASEDNTAEVVASFKDERIRYINPGRRLSMSHHWEFALNHVSNGYVTILGDDDGILPNALYQVAAILEKHPLPAIGWRFGNFNWKGLPPHFMVPMGAYYRIVDAKSEITKIFEKSIYDTIKFPSLYGGFISISHINKLKNDFGGSFFHSRIPDFFSGAIVAATVDKYIRMDYPITINATSRHSTGFATVNTANNQSAYNDLVKSLDNIPFHAKLIFIRCNAVPIAEAMLQVRELVPSFPIVGIKKLLKEIAGEMIVTDDKLKFDNLREGIVKIGERNGLQEYSKNLIHALQFKPKATPVKNKFSPLSLSLYIDTTKTDIATVQDACNYTASVIPKSCKEIKNSYMINFFRLNSTIRFLYLKYLSRKRTYL